ncbi:MAG: helix-turn-helix domain-containing protein [Proteobacteria bacterium]|nr:helix-turn-helix domain-containing protein [Pseudomonadota bacterium]MBU1594287.1 helix-turn-helix domain-containing protein [Pseudomonadota bacterium]
MQEPTPAPSAAQMDAALREVLRELLEPAARLEALRRKELITGQEVEDLYGLAYGTLRNWRAKGHGPKMTRIGALVYYKHQDLLAFIAAHQVKTYDQQ